MKKQYIKIALVATLVLAMAFALSCSTEDGDDGPSTNNTSSATVAIMTYYDVALGNLSTNCPSINIYPELLNSVMVVTDTWVDIARNCLINKQDYYNQTPSQVTSFLNTNNLGGYINDFNMIIPMSPYYEGILIYKNTSGYYVVLVIGYSGYNRTPSVSSSSARATSSSSKALVSSSSANCNLTCASQVQSEMAASGSLYSGAFCSKVASCGTACKARYSQCGSSGQSSQSSVANTKCGTGSYDATNTNLRCENDVIETKCGTSWYNATNTNLRCENDVVETKCGTSWYNATNTNLRCQNSIVEAKCGTSWYATNTNLRCQNSIVETKCGTNEWYDASTQYCSSGTPKNYGFVDYEYKTYKTVEIGTQTWMAENLNYAAEGSECNDNKESNCDKYGRLYNWSTTMALPSSCKSTTCSGQVQSKHQGICPSGWHIPSIDEWNALKTYIESNKNCSDCDAKYLKATIGWNEYIDNYYQSQSGNGLDSYGFSALPSGFGYSSDDYRGIGYSGYWWSASEYNSYRAYSCGMINSKKDASGNDYMKYTLYSVRCLKD